MWTLEGNGNQPGRIHYLPCGQTLMVSRKEGHILLTDDNSISRQHAAIVLTHAENNLKNPNERPQVRLQDLGAKYGTYVNGGIEQDEKIVEDRLLMDGDRIRFGMLTNTWRLAYHPLVVTTSVLEPASKVDLQTAFLKLGGHIVSDWNDACQYLVMNNITLTIKIKWSLNFPYVSFPSYESKFSMALPIKIPFPKGLVGPAPYDLNQLYPDSQNLNEKEYESQNINAETDDDYQYINPDNGIEYETDSMNSDYQHRYYSIDEDYPMIARNYRISRLHRRNIYSQIEVFLNKAGLNGRQCALRTICEVAETPFVEGVTGDILNALFLASLPGRYSDPSEGSDYNSFVEAEINGRTNGDCQLLYPECKRSFLNFITEIVIM